MNLARPTPVLLLLTMALFGLPLTAAPSFTQQAFQLPAAAESLLIADLDGDGQRELITVIDHTLRIYIAGDSGFDFASGYVELELEADAVGWDISTGFAGGNGAAIITLEDGRVARAWQLSNGRLGEPTIIADNLQGFISRGLNRLHFARDINNDGFEDLVIPGAGVLHIYINDGKQSFQQPLLIQSDTRLRTALNINRFNRSAGQAIRIPYLELRDLNGDNLADLISRTDERLDVFLASSTAETYFPRAPSYSVDIAEIEARLGEFDIDNLDFSNLTGVLALTHEEILEDVDNDGIHDLLLREGGKVSLFAGTADGMNFEQPRQVLRSGGNVLSTFLYDENEDGLKDLWLWRVEPISVGDVFVWLALSGSIAVEAFVYHNDGERFARRPARRITIDLRFPSVMRLANAYQSLNREADRLRADHIAPSTLASIDELTERHDLLVLMHDQVRIFLNSITPDQDNDDFLGSLGYSRQRDNYVIDIRDIINRINVSGNPLLAQVEGREADQIIELGAAAVQGDIIAARVNADAIDDVFVFTDYDGSHIRGLLLLSQ